MVWVAIICQIMCLDLVASAIDFGVALFLLEVLHGRIFGKARTSFVFLKFRILKMQQI